MRGPEFIDVAFEILPPRPLEVVSVCAAKITHSVGPWVSVSRQVKDSLIATLGLSWLPAELMMGAGDGWS